MIIDIDYDYWYWSWLLILNMIIDINYDLCTYWFMIWPIFIKYGRKLSEGRSSFIVWIKKYYGRRIDLCKNTVEVKIFVAQTFLSSSTMLIICSLRYFENTSTVADEAFRIKFNSLSSLTDIITAIWEVISIC